MNKNIIIAVLAIILLGSLYLNFQSKSETPTEKEQVNSKVSADASFEKKQECASYRPTIERKLTELNFQNENVVVTNHLDEMWFSPSMNTCLYSSNELWQYLKEKKIEQGYNIYDYLGNKLLFNASTVGGVLEGRSVREAFENRKTELKK